jgi:formamidopyrimidine-DNA glycosylase
MPELPEVETIARGVNERLSGDTIQLVWFSGKREPFKTPPDVMFRVLRGKRIECVYRIGKHIVFELAPPAGPGLAETAVSRSAGELAPGKAQWLVHLGMTGRLLVADPTIPVPPHTHAILALASGRELRFVDPRRFGRLSLFTPQKPGDAGNGRGFQGIGREPLSIPSAEFIALFRRSRSPVKSALLNQKLLQGVGNIYADEALFRAGIRPRRRAHRLTRLELERLRGCLRKVLKEAIAMGGSSVSDYVDAAGVRGFFQLEHKVYMRTGQPCLVCGQPIQRILLGGRGTHYCPGCQK